MTDLDPLRPTPEEGTELAARAAREPRGREPRGRPGAGMDGPTGHAMTTESAGDPDQASVVSDEEAQPGRATPRERRADEPRHA